MDHARQALSLGITDAEFLRLTSQLLEQAGLLGEAEAVLKRIPAGGGCGCN